MPQWSKIERWSWIAGIVGTLVAAIGYFFPRDQQADSVKPKKEELKPSAPSIQQSAGDGSIQLGNVGGNVVITMQADPIPAKVHSTLQRQLPNIFQELGPGASIARMKGLLGQPYAQGQGMAGMARILENADQFFGAKSKKYIDPRRQFSYRFDDAYVQIRSADGSSVSELMVVTLDVKNPSKLAIRDSGVILGQTLLTSLLKNGESAENDYSSKHNLEYLYDYRGAPGGYLHYYYGVLEAYNIPPPLTKDLVNFGALTSKKMDWLYFDWAHFQ